MEWLIDGLVPKASLEAVIAPMKAGKTTLIRAMIASIVTGENEFIGKEINQQLIGNKSIAYMAIEDPVGQVRHAFADLGINETHDNFHLFQGDQQMPKDTVNEIVKWIEENEPAILVIDTILHIGEGKVTPNDGDKVMFFLQPLLFVARRTGTTVIFLYHTSKKARNDSGYNALFAVNGSQQWNASVDVTINMFREGKEGDETYSYQVQGRIPDIPKTALELDPETGRMSSVGTVEEVKFSRILRDVSTCIDEASEPLKTEDIVTDTQHTKAKVLQALKDLVSKGTIFRNNARGLRGNPVLYSKDCFEQVNQGGLFDEPIE